MLFYVSSLIEWFFGNILFDISFVFNEHYKSLRKYFGSLCKKKEKIANLTTHDMCSNSFETELVFTNTAHFGWVW